MERVKPTYDELESYIERLDRQRTDAQATIAALEQRIQELQDKVGECAKVPVTFDPYW